MRSIKLTIFLLLTTFSFMLMAQGQSFVRSAVIDPPATFGSGFGATVSGVDLDGDGKVEIYSVNGMSDYYTGDEYPQIIKYELTDGSWDSVWAASFPDERQNTWAALTTGDLDGDSKMEIIWGYVNSFSTNTTPPRIVVFETSGDDAHGVSDGAGGWDPNTSWDMDVPESTNMRALKWFAYDVDEDGKEEVVFAERRDHFNFGVISVDDVPDDAAGTETWMMELNQNTELYNIFVRSAVIDGPNGSFGGVVAGVDLDDDGMLEIYAINDNWNDSDGGELIPTLFKYEMVNGAWLLDWSTTLPDMEQNTWPILTTGDLDSDGLAEIIWCPINNLGANSDPPRIAVYEVPADSMTKASGILGIDNMDGTLAPNAQWNLGVPAGTEMRPFRGAVADIDNDGTQEFVFAERRNFYGWGVVSVDDIPNTGDGSETWTMEAAGANMLVSMNLDIAFEDDSDVANWSHYDETNFYTTETWVADAGVDSTGALELGDAGYDMLAKRPLMAKTGVNYSVSLDVKTFGWNDSATYPIYVTIEGLDADPDTININNTDTGFTHISFSGVTAAESGYLRIKGSNTLLANNVWVDNFKFTLNDGSVAPSSDYRDMAVLDQTMYVFDSDGGIVEVDGANSYAVKDRYQAYPGWSWLSANWVDIDGDTNMELVTGDYLYNGTGGVWVLTPDADSLVGSQIATFAGKRLTNVEPGDLNGDGMLDFAVGFRGTDEIYGVFYMGGDITSDASYTTKLLDQGVLGTPGIGQMDLIETADLNNDGTDEVLYGGIPRSVPAGTQPLTIGSYSDTLTADAGRRWDICNANGDIQLFDGSGNLQEITHTDSGWVIKPSQPSLVNGTFLSASAADIDDDGIDEIFVGNWYDAKVMVLKKTNGAWVAHEAYDFAGDGGSRLNGGAVGDLDNDGYIDFVTGSRQSDPLGQVYRVEFTGMDVSDPDSYQGEVIDQEYDVLFSQLEVINLANLDDDPELEVLYTSDYARGSNASTDPQFPIIILDVALVQATPIADARIDDNGDFLPDLLGQTVTIKGVVTTPDFNLSSSSSSSIYVQDETAGINLYINPKPTVVPAVGDLVQITGEVAEYNGLAELAVDGSVEDNIVKLGTGTVPTPVTLTIAEFMMAPESYEGSIVLMKGLALFDGEWPDSGSNANLNLWDGMDAMIMRVDKDVNVAAGGEPVWPVDVVGVIGQYDSSDPKDAGYQIFPRYYDDITQGVAVAPFPYFEFTDETATAFDGQTITVDDEAEEFTLTWHPAIDFNDDPLIYRIATSVDGGTVSYPSGVLQGDTTWTFTGADLLTWTGGAVNQYNVMMTVETKGAELPIVPSIDTLNFVVDIVVGVDAEDLIPKKFFVDQNYPNPFNPTTTIKFGLPKEAKVDVRVYNILGQEVAVLVNNQIMNAGVHYNEFNASRLASGTYIFRVSAGDNVQIKKMLLLK